MADTNEADTNEGQIYCHVVDNLLWTICCGPFIVDWTGATRIFTDGCFQDSDVQSKTLARRIANTTSISNMRAHFQSLMYYAF